MSYYYCKTCHCKHGIGLGCPQAVTNVTNVVPVAGLDLYELDIAMGKITSDVTYEEWRAMQEVTGEITEYGDNA